MTGHCFISYSTADALPFATWLADELEGGNPLINVWFDKRDIDPARDWDDQIVEGIKSCKCMAFVMTGDSTAPGSMCKNEWTWALKYKKIVIPLRVDENVEQPFGLGNRQWIDFTGEFERGIEKLRKLICELDSPAGILQSLRDRIADAEHDLRRAKPENQARIQADIVELKKQLEAQQLIVDNPRAAQEQTQKNINSGLERERLSEKSFATKTLTKFINPPPGIAPTYFQDRYIETCEIAKFIKDESKRIMTIVGRGGVGKTAMVCRLLKALEGGSLPDDLGGLKIDGIVYLSERGSHSINFANIFADLSKLLPAEASERLKALYREPNASVEAKMNALLDQFQGEPVLVMLDNFEPVVNLETQKITDNELNEALCSLVRGPHHMVNVLITTRIAPRELNLCEPGRQRVLMLDEGLESPFAENILRELDEDGKLGLKVRDATDPLLQSIREKTRGYPRALEAFFAILSADRYTTLEELVAMPLPDNVVEALVGEAFSRLDATAQKVMQALATFNRPVTPAAVDYLLQPHLPEIDSASILNRLVNLHFVRREAGRYYLHPMDSEYAFITIPEGNIFDKFRSSSGREIYSLLLEFLSHYPDLFENQDTFEQVAEKTSPAFLIDLYTTIQNLDSALIEKMENVSNREDENFLATLDEFLRIPPIWTQYDLISRAANYFKEVRKPREEWKKLDDLSAQLAEFTLRFEANDYDTAYEILHEIEFDYLLRWGHYRMLIEMHSMLLEKLQDIEFGLSNLYNLGWAYYSTGKILEAIPYYEIGLEIAQEENLREWQENFLNPLGVAYRNIVNIPKAFECYEKSLEIANETGNKKSEGTILANFGNSYSDIGDICKAMEFLTLALEFSRKNQEKYLENFVLDNLGHCNAKLGNFDKAIQLHKEALFISQEIGDRRNESISIENIGHAYLELEEFQKSGDAYQQAIQIADELLVPQLQNFSRWGLAQAYLSQNDLGNACSVIEAALQYDVPKNNPNVSTLHGIIAFRKGEVVKAQESFTKSINQADEILNKTAGYYTALDAKGLALCGLILCRSRLQHDPNGGEDLSRSKRDLQQAIETFRAARKIAPHAGIVKCNLRLFDELAKCDPEGLLAGVRAAVEENANKNDRE